MDIQAVAVPYDMDASAFYFYSPESFDEQFPKQINRYGQIVEEFEIQLIDGNDSIIEFNNVYDMNQCNISKWFEYFERFLHLNECEQVALSWLMTVNNNSIESAFDKVEDVYVFDGMPEDYVYELVNECYDLPEFALNYFDYKQLAYDMGCNGEFIQIGDYLITNPQDI